MAEYSREQRSQLSRAIANCGTGSRQLKKIVDNRGVTNLNPMILGSNIIQGVFTLPIENCLDNAIVNNGAALAHARKMKTKKHNTEGGHLNVTMTPEYFMSVSNRPHLHRKVGQNELFMIVSHGITLQGRLPMFANQTPLTLATNIFRGKWLPAGYMGEIYLNGCSTGSDIEGESFVNMFAAELRRLSDNAVDAEKLGTFTVKGNKGPNIIIDSGMGMDEFVGSSAVIVKDTDGKIRPNLNYDPHDSKHYFTHQGTAYLRGSDAKTVVTSNMPKGQKFIGGLFDGLSH